MQHGHAVDPLREAHAHDGHVEHVVVAARVGFRAEREHPVDRQPCPCGVGGEVPLDQLAREAVDARGHRGVRREDRARAGQLKRLVEREPGGDVLPDPLQAEEAGVPLVGVEHLGLGVAGDRAVGPHCPHAADTQEQLLAEPVLAAAAVQAVGDLVLCGLVLLHIGVEHEQRYPADRGQPDLRGQQLAIGEGHVDLHRVAAGGPQQGQRQPVRVVGRVPLRLPAVSRQRLREVPVPVQQADADDRDAEVARGLQVVAGQDAEAAGVLREDGGDAVLR